jgi:putative nucleotidyltransferase with HDIG domain
MNSLKPDPEARAILDEYIRVHQEIINALSHPSFIIDTDSNIVFSNNAMKQFYGNIETPENSKYYQLFHQSDSPPGNCPLASSVKTGKAERAELYVPLLDKNLIVYASPLADKGKLIGSLCSVMDISEIKKSEEDHREIIDIYSKALSEMKIREQKAQTGREAFFNMLEDINESYKELEDLFIKLIRVMINSLDAKSPWTKGHSERVSLYAEKIAREMLIDSEEIKNIRLAGLLHDIGKIGTFDYLLDKPGKLTPEEFEIVKKHPAQGAAILKEIKQLRDIIPMVEYHHEKIDGTGYPYRLKGEEIPIGAKILHVADSYDSMTSDRPYRPAPDIEYALSELHKHKGTQFDAEVVDAFLRVLEGQKRLVNVSQG